MSSGSKEMRLDSFTWKKLNCYIYKLIKADDELRTSSLVSWYWNTTEAPVAMKKGKKKQKNNCIHKHVHLELNHCKVPDIQPHIRSSITNLSKMSEIFQEFRRVQYSILLISDS